MRRRRFIKVAAGIGALGIIHKRSLSSVQIEGDERYTLNPVFEHLPQLFAVDQVQHKKPNTLKKNGALKQDRLPPISHMDHKLYPLLIGVGLRSERIISQIARTADIPQDAGLYRTGLVHGESSEWLQLRLQKSAAAMLLVDADDEKAGWYALALARRLSQAKIYLASALVLNTQVAAGDPAWKAALRVTLPLIEVCETDSTLAVGEIVQALLPGLLFHQQTLVAVDLSDIRSILEMGSCAWTTAVRWEDPIAGRQVLKRAKGKLRLASPRALCAWVNASLDFSFYDFDEILVALKEIYSCEDVVLAPIINGGYGNSQWLLSLTVIGEV